jgi:hypothetical protein
MQSARGILTIFYTHTETAPASFKVFACRTWEDVHEDDHVASGCSSATSIVPCAVTTRHPAARALPQPCCVPRLLVTQPHGLYLNRAVHRDYSSSGCTGSTAPMACIRTRHLAAQFLFDRSHWLSSCTRSLRLAAQLHRRLTCCSVAQALL